MRRVFASLVCLMFATMSFAQPFTKETSHYSASGLLNEVLVRDGGSLGLNVFGGILAAATPVIGLGSDVPCSGGNCGADQVLNNALYRDDATGDLGLGIYVIGAGGTLPAGTTNGALLTWDTTTSTWIEIPYFTVVDQIGSYTATETMTDSLEYNVFEMEAVVDDGALTNKHLTGYTMTLAAAGGLVDGGGADAHGVLKIVIPDKANVDVNAVGTGHALMVDDNRTGTEADNITEAAVVIDAEGTYGLYVAGCNTYMSGTLRAWSEIEMAGNAGNAGFDCNLDIDWDSDSVQTEATFDTAFTSTTGSTADYDQILQDVNITKTDGHLTGYAHTISVQDSVSGGTWYNGMGGLEIIKADDPDNRSINVKGVGNLLWLDDDRAGAEADQGLEATQVIDADGVYALYIQDGDFWIQYGDARFDQVINANGDIDWDSDAVGEVVTFDTAFTSTTGAAASYTMLDIDVDITKADGNLDGYGIDLNIDNTVSGAGYEAIGGIKIALADANNVLQPGSGVGHALYIDDNRSGAEVTTSSGAHASLLIDTAGTQYAASITGASYGMLLNAATTSLFIETGKTWIYTTAGILQVDTTIDSNADIDWDGSTATEEIDADATIPSTASLTYNMMSLTETITHDGGAADVWDGAILKIQKSNNANVGTNAADRTNALWIIGDDDPANTPTGAPLVLIDDNRSGAEVNGRAEAGVLIYGSTGGYGLNVPTGLVEFAGAGTYLWSDLNSIQNDIDYDANASDEEIDADATINSTASLTYNMMSLTETITHDGGAADVWDGAILKIQKSNNANVATNAVDHTNALWIIGDDDAANPATGAPLIEIDDNRAGAEASVPAEATMHIASAGDTALYISDGDLEVVGNAYVGTAIATNYIYGPATYLSGAMDLVTNADVVGMGNDGYFLEGANSNTTELIVNWPGWVEADGDLTMTDLVVYTKTTTGDPAFDWEGLVCINTFDNTVNIYADGGWRTMASGW